VSDAISVLTDRKSLLSEDSFLERVIVAALQYYGARHLCLDGEFAFPINHLRTPEDCAGALDYLKQLDWHRGHLPVDELNIMAEAMRRFLDSDGTRHAIGDLGIQIVNHFGLTWLLTPVFLRSRPTTHADTIPKALTFYGLPRGADNALYRSRRFWSNFPGNCFLNILIIENLDLSSAFQEICPIYTTLTMANEADDPGTGCLPVSSMATIHGF
jgi:hypothetical protein